jgi:hypothetical protein
MEPETAEKIRNDHKTLLHCLQHSGLISPLTYEKIAQQTDNGIIYKPWEIIAVAHGLTEYEEELKKINIEAELKPLLNSGILTPADITPVITKIRGGQINEKAEVIRRFGKKITIPGLITKGDIKAYIIALLDASLEFLPFYRSHTVQSVDHYDLVDPYYKLVDHLKGHTLKHICVRLVFNQKEYTFSVKLSNDYYRIAPGYSFGLFFRILHSLCKEYGDQYEVITLKDYFLGQRPAENENIQSYFLLLARKRAGHSFFLKEKMGSHIFSSIGIAEKQDYLASLFTLFDEGRFSQADQEFTYQNVIYADLSDRTIIPHFIPGFTYLLWYDILSDTYQYRDIITDLARISNGRFRPENVTDGFASVNDGETLEVTLQVHSKTYRITLTKGTVDYDLLGLLDEIQTGNDLGGKFYIFNDGSIEDGYALIFLSHEETVRLKQNALFQTHELKTSYRQKPK